MTLVIPVNPSPEENQPGLTEINRTSRLPLYQQIYEILRGQLIRGNWAPGELFPTEFDLIRDFQVSRVTIRQVMDRLVSEGFIYRQRGRGTFVAEPTLEEGLTRIISFTEDMRRRGLAAGTKVLVSKILPATDDVALALHMKPSEEVVYLKRLRSANNEPMCIEESHLNHRLCPGILEHDFGIQPLREILESKYRIRISRALQKIHAVVSDDEMGRMLKSPAPSALLFIERTSFNDYDTPVEFLRLYFRGDRYSLYNELKD